MGNLASLGTVLRARLPLIMIGLIVTASMMFGVVVIVPQMKVYNALTSELNDGQQILDATSTAQGASDNGALTQHKIEAVQTLVDVANGGFLTGAQVDDLQHKVYDYADGSGAKVASFQEQPQSQAQPSKTLTVYDTRIFHMQVTGSVVQLMNFVILLREASTPGVAISGLAVTRSGGQYGMALNLVVYTSNGANGKVFESLSGTGDPQKIALAATDTPIPTATLAISPTPTPTVASSPTPTATVAPPTPTSIAQCGQAKSQKMQELHFAQIEQASGTCDAQVWNFTFDKPNKFVMDIVRRSGSGQYRMELHDSGDKVVTSTLSSVDGRGILVSDSPAGSYTLNIVPLTASGTWVYNIAIWQGIPALSFAWAQNSYSSHSSIGTKSNTMSWGYTLNGGTQTYKIDSTRTDGNLDYTIMVLDSAQKQVATAQSTDGNVTVNLTTPGGTYLVKVTTKEGTSGSYRIALEH